MVLMLLCVTPKKQAAERANLWDGCRLLRFLVYFPVIATALSCLERASILSRSAASIPFILMAALTLWMASRKMGREGGRFPKYTAPCGILTFVVSYANTRVMQKFVSNQELAIVWMIMVVFAEVLMIFFRKGLRTVDFSQLDSRLVPLIFVFPLAMTMVLKKVPLLSIQDVGLIYGINAVCFVWEVVSRITVVQRDMYLDRCLWRESVPEGSAWLDPAHKQAYIHAEILSEIFELAFPIPIAVTLYLIQFAPSGTPPEGWIIALNCGLQIALELLADFCAISIKSKWQGTFYKVALGNFGTRTQFLLVAGLVVGMVSAQSNLMIVGQLRVAKTPDGHYITLL